MNEVFEFLEEIGERLEEKHKMNNITVYTKNQCVQCQMSKNVLNDLGISYTEKNVDTNEKFMDEAKATGYKSMPIILKDGQVVASGFMPDVLNQLV